MEFPGKCQFKENESHDSVVFELEEFPKSCFNIFMNYRRTGLLCDVLIIVNGNEICAHSIVLTATIPYFAKIIFKQKDSKPFHVTIDNINHDSVEKLIDFAYTGRIKVTTENARTLFKAACVMEVDEVKKVCLKFFVRRLNPKNVLDVWRGAKSVRKRNLVTALDNFIGLNFNSIHKTEGSLCTSSSFIKRLLKKTNLDCSEEQMQRFLKEWFHKYPERWKVSSRKLKTMRRKFPLFPDHVEIPVEQECQVWMLRNDPNQPLPGFDAFKQLPDQKENYLPEVTLVDKHLVFNFNYRNDATGECKMFTTLTFRADYLPIAFAFAQVSNMLFVRSFNAFSTYNTSTRSWHVLHVNLGYRLEAGAAVVGNRFFICGGRDHFKALESVECFDLENYYLHMTSMKVARSSLGVVACGKYLYALGGTDGHNVFSHVERYDTDMNEWSNVSPMQSPRCAMGCYSDGWRIYVCGGKSSLNDGECLASAEVYDPFKDKWDNIASMAQGRYRCSLVLQRGGLAATGGLDSVGNVVTIMEAYSPEHNYWAS